MVCLILAFLLNQNLLNQNLLKLNSCFFIKNKIYYNIMSGGFVYVPETYWEDNKPSSDQPMGEYYNIVSHETKYIDFVEFIEILKIKYYKSINTDDEQAIGLLKDILSKKEILKKEWISRPMKVKGYGLIASCVNYAFNILNDKSGIVVYNYLPNEFLIQS